MTARTISRLLAWGFTASLGVACASSHGGGEPRDWGADAAAPTATATSSDGGPCAPKTCLQLGQISGKHDDGCGKTLDCTAQACTPKTCKELGQTSGKHDDGCGNTIDCSSAQACADAKEKNDTKETGTDLGAMTDNPNTTRLVADLTLFDGDVDWFRFTVTDQGFGGNPLIRASVTQNLDVAVYFVCDSQPDFSTCGVATDTQDNTVGRGCRGKKTVSLSTDCSGLTETGKAYVRVAKAANNGQCTAYALTVDVQ